MDPSALIAKTREALRLQRAGRIAEAAAAWEQILERAPHHPPACNGLALIRLAQNQPLEALRLLRVAVETKPDSAIYRNSLANALKAIGRHAEAADAYRESMRLDPNYVSPEYNLGLLELSRGRPHEARGRFERLIARRPDFGPAYQSLAGILLESVGPEQAAACLRRGVAAARDGFDLVVELAALLRDHGRLEDAIACQERAVALRPDRSASYNDLGALHQIQGRVEPALACFDRALALDPRSGHAHFNRAKLLADLNRFDEACSAFERAIVLEPPLATEAACHLAVARRHLCDWRDETAQTAELIGRIERLIRDAPARGLPPLTLNFVPVPAALRLAVARHLGRGVARESEAIGRRSPLHHRPRDPEAPLRIGYVSPDFRVHAVGSLIHDLFRHHDRSAVSVHAYSLVSVDDAFTRAVREGVDRFFDVSRETALATAQRIHADRIDVLVDVAGYTTHSRTAIFALRPAPVQMHWLGYLDTMGADFLPYILADATVVPESASEDFSETILELPRGFAVASPMPIADTPTRAALGLPEDAFVFCCMNGLHKIDADVFDAWMRILARVPRSLLWLADEGSATARANLAREAQARGVDPIRLRFAPRAPLPDYLARYRVADLFLDTFAYNAGATAAGALRAGLPVLTRPGTSFMSRMGASLCRGASLEDMICATTGDYVDRAVALAEAPSALAAVRSRLAGAQTNAPLFDLPGFARQLEAAYRAAWQHRAEKSSARRITLSG